MELKLEATNGEEHLQSHRTDRVAYCGYLDSIDGTDLADRDVARGESLQCTIGIKLSKAV